MKIFIDGQFYPEAKAKVSVFDHGFLYGDGLFETMRAYRGKCFRLDQHLERLWEGANYLRIHIPYTKSILKQFIHQTITENQLADAYVRVTVSRGVGKTGPDPSTCLRASIVIIALPLTPYPKETYKNGLSATILNIRRNSMEALPPNLKSMNFLNNILAKIELKDKQKEEGFFLNSDGYLTEGVVSNLFIVKNHQVITPSIDSGLLAGITREVVLELCAEHNIKSVQGKMLPGELLEADECFITNSLAEIVPVTTLDNQFIGTGQPGKTTNFLAAGYSQLVKEECE